MSVDHPEAGPGGEPIELVLPAQADIRVGSEIQDQCRAALAATGDVRLACGDVERIDAAVLQCLGALDRGLRQSGRQLVLVEPSPGFTRAVDLLGFGPLFEGTDQPPLPVAAEPPGTPERVS